MYIVLLYVYVHFCSSYISLVRSSTFYISVFLAVNFPICKSLRSSLLYVLGKKGQTEMCR